MSLYGLDVIVGPNDEFNLVEINGSNCGMFGFELEGLERYNPVILKVSAMLEARYGEISILTPSSSQSFGDNLANRVVEALYDIEPIRPLVRKLSHPPEFFSSGAHLEWFVDRRKDIESLASKHPMPMPYSFPEYVGQESVVLNFPNAAIKHPSVNSFDTEAVTRNKFVQHMVLRDTPVGKYLAPFTLVGLGITDEQAVASFLEKYSLFVQKPLVGARGWGVKVFSRDDVREKYTGSYGPIPGISVFDTLRLTGNLTQEFVYVEDLVSQDKFTFEDVISLLQPFVGVPVDGKYSSIRAIVCNGKFVSAYQRVSTNSIVNKSLGASCQSYDWDDEFARRCEEIISTLHSETKGKKYVDIRRKAYEQYFEERNNRNKDKRSLQELDRTLDVLREITSLM